MNGKIVLITGGARGMGRITALALAKMGAHVIIADWEGEHGARTCSEINAAGPGSAEFIYCNVSSMPSVRELAAAVLDRHPKLHVLINNAGIHREMQGIFKWGAMLVFGIGSLLGLSTPEKGARTHIWLASSPDLEGVSGKYFQSCKEIATCPHADDMSERAKVWALSESLVAKV